MNKNNEVNFIRMFFIFKFDFSGCKDKKRKGQKLKTFTSFSLKNI
jgi:hypothetical protein